MARDMCMSLNDIRIECKIMLIFFFFKQKTAYEMRISDWSSDVCSSDLDQVGDAVGDRLLRLACVAGVGRFVFTLAQGEGDHLADGRFVVDDQDALVHGVPRLPFRWFSGAASRLRFYDRCVTASATVERSEEHTTELQSLMRISYA